MIRFRSVQDADWPAIGQLASNDVQEADHRDIDTRWLENRLNFKGSRTHAVAELDGDIVGYCSIERKPDEPLEDYRAFLVADWDENNTFIYEALFKQLENMLSDNNAKRVWLRELTGDTKLIHFFRSKGFDLSTPYVVAGKEMVNLSKSA